MDTISNEKGLDKDSTLFLQWLQERYEQIDNDLKPYWIEYKNREESCGNMYGIGTPRDRRLLREQEHIYSLIYQLEKGKSVEQISTELLDCKSDDKDYVDKLEIFKDYLESFSPPQRKKH